MSTQGRKNDVKPYQFEKGADGKYSKIRKMIDIDPDKKYVIAFLDKTRNDEDKQTVIYLFDGKYNRWKEIGYRTNQRPQVEEWRINPQNHS